MFLQYFSNKKYIEKIEMQYIVCLLKGKKNILKKLELSHGQKSK